MRALARWGIAPCLAAPLGAWAFGLGDIELQSSLNQPFQARITLVSATPEDLQGLRIALATPETFDRYGLDRPDYLLNFLLPAFVAVRPAADTASPPKRSDRLSVPATCRSSTAADSMAASLIR